MTNSAVRRARIKEIKANSKVVEEKLTAAVDIISDLKAKSGTALNLPLPIKVRCPPMSMLRERKMR